MFGRGRCICKGQQTARRFCRRETEKIIVGKRRQIDLILMAVLSGGHVLLNDLPGSGKTTLIKTLSLALGCEFKRLQFTPDLLPSDIVGMTVFNQKTGEFQMVKGPVHTNILLADEINRAIPRTQSALLEAMEEGQTTIDGVTMELPRPFLVMATQNPVERESTFMLPAAQMDRFFICLSMGYPDAEEEVRILETLGDGTDYGCVQAVTAPEVLMGLREEIKQVKVSEALQPLHGGAGAENEGESVAQAGRQSPGFQKPLPGKQGMGRHAGPRLRGAGGREGHLDGGDGPPGGPLRGGQIPEEDGGDDS